MPHLMRCSLSDKYSYRRRWDTGALDDKLSERLWNAQPFPPEYSHLQPRLLLLEKNSTQTKQKRPPDVFGWWHTTVVSERFKDMVEQMEPGVHMFVPIPIAWASWSDSGECEIEEHVEGEYYLFSIKNVRNCIVESETTLWRNGATVVINYLGGVALDEETTKGLSLWRSMENVAEIATWYEFCSDQFKQEYRTRKLVGLTFKKTISSQVRL